MDELLRLAVTRQDLLPEASTALEGELSARGLEDIDLQAVRDQLRTPAEDEHHLSPEESPPQPTELPEDWFDEKPDEYRLWLVASAAMGEKNGGRTLLDYYCNSDRRLVADTLMRLCGIGIDNPFSAWSWAWSVIWATLWALYLSSEDTRKSFVPRDDVPMKDN